MKVLLLLFIVACVYCGESERSDVKVDRFMLHNDGRIDQESNAFLAAEWMGQYWNVTVVEGYYNKKPAIGIVMLVLAKFGPENPQMKYYENESTPTSIIIGADIQFGVWGPFIPRLKEPVDLMVELLSKA